MPMPARPAAARATAPASAWPGVRWPLAAPPPPEPPREHFDPGHFPHHHRRPAVLACRLPGQGAAAGQRRLQVRPDPAVRRPAGAVCGKARAGPGSAGLPRQQLPRPGTGQRCRDPAVLPAHLRCQLPDVLQDQRGR
ncbi:hypothetical protein G6F46_014033 [Rhizopus delemar]|nr:hypothetical protein G6F46_014033 [Rhizopus delemar]